MGEAVLNPSLALLQSTVAIIFWSLGIQKAGISLSVSARFRRVLENRMHMMPLSSNLIQMGTASGPPTLEAKVGKMPSVSRQMQAETLPFAAILAARIFRLHRVHFRLP